MLLWKIIRGYWNHHVWMTVWKSTAFGISRFGILRGSRRSWSIGIKESEHVLITLLLGRVTFSTFWGCTEVLPMRGIREIHVSCGRECFKMLRKHSCFLCAVVLLEMKGTVRLSHFQCVIWPDSILVSDVDKLHHMVSGFKRPAELSLLGCYKASFARSRAILLLDGLYGSSGQLKPPKIKLWGLQPLFQIFKALLWVTLSTCDGGSGYSLCLGKQRQTLTLLPFYKSWCKWSLARNKCAQRGAVTKSVRWTVSLVSPASPGIWQGLYLTWSARMVL